MRYMEFADAEAQLGLLRVIIDNTWAAIAKQAEDQKKAAELRAAQEKAYQATAAKNPIAPLKPKRSNAQTDATPTKAELLQPQRPIPPKKPIGVNNRAKDSRSSA